jgi:hypothetical protein
MLDKTIRGKLLSRLYVLRSKGFVPLTPQNLEIDISQNELLRVSAQLESAGLIVGKFVKNNGLEIGEYAFGMGKISGSGVNVIEGEPFLPFKIEFMPTTINNTTISGSTNVAVGTNITQNIETSFVAMAKMIDESDFSMEQKIEAKSLFVKALEHPVTRVVVSSALASILGAMTK